ncbi:hypothetical protein Bbelb_232780 [Branchiostoma belcheri]|nr:hypothetical protein Bbelb_232780 [Branchiostoma belcheri]
MNNTGASHITSRRTARTTSVQLFKIFSPPPTPKMGSDIFGMPTELHQTLCKWSAIRGAARGIMVQHCTPPTAQCDLSFFGGGRSSFCLSYQAPGLCGMMREF